MTTAAIVALFALLLVDCLQTLQIAKHPERWYERNPILGEHPSRLAVLVWFGGVALLAAILWASLPPSIGMVLALIGAGMEAVCVANNVRLGIPLR